MKFVWKLERVFDLILNFFFFKYVGALAVESELSHYKCFQRFIVRSCYRNTRSSKALHSGSQERFLALRCQAVLYSITSSRFSIRILCSFSPISSVSSLLSLKRTRPHCSIHSSKFSLPQKYPCAQVPRFNMFSDGKLRCVVHVHPHPISLSFEKPCRTRVSLDRNSPRY